MLKETGIFAVHIESMNHGIPGGWFMNPYVEEYITFQDLGDMLLKMDATLHCLRQKKELDGADAMPCFHSLRDFSFHSSPEFFYLIQVISTEHNSWQGFITGSKRTNVTFKSALDCARKMNRAMCRRQVTLRL